MTFDFFSPVTALQISASSVQQSCAVDVCGVTNGTSVVETTETIDIECSHLVILAKQCSDIGHDVNWQQEAKKCPGMEKFKEIAKCLFLSIENI